MEKARWLLFFTMVMLIGIKSVTSQFRVTQNESKNIPIVSAPPTQPITSERCITLPVLMYHHIQPQEEAIKKDQEGLSTDTALFSEHLKYLKGRGYVSVSPKDLIAFFDEGGELPEKGIMITFDDGYDDLAVNAAPALAKHGFQGVVFLPTGLVESEGYLGWRSIAEMSTSGYFTFGNHTWSHMSVEGNPELVRKEITTADAQLTQRELNSQRIFAYPYGEKNGVTKRLLNQLGYQLGFTTDYGDLLCRSERLNLPRVRGKYALDL